MAKVTTPVYYRLVVFRGANLQFPFIYYDEDDKPVDFTNVANPTDDQDVATKKWVSDNFGAGGASAFVDLTDTPACVPNMPGSDCEFVWDNPY